MNVLYFIVVNLFVCWHCVVYLICRVFSRGRRHWQQTVYSQLVPKANLTLALTLSPNPVLTLTLAFILTLTLTIT